MPYPLFERFPQLQRIPTVQLCTLPSTVERVTLDDATFWIKRDDINAPEFGGNKVRSLEFLLGRLKPGKPILTLGGAGSTHVLATAIHAGQMGSPVVGMRWQHDMNPTADRISALTQQYCHTTRVASTAIGAMCRALVYRLTHNVHYIAAGGSAPLGVLAQVNAAFELIEQVKRGVLPHPARIVIPLGSGGTIAGLALGLLIENFDTMLIGVQVAPAITANRLRIARLMRRTARLIERMVGERLPPVSMKRVAVVRDVYAGGYGRPYPDAVLAAQQLKEQAGIWLDETYSAKAFVVARELARADERPTLFWNTFDGRVLE
jgi:D-cysteine desulfhydrase